MGSVGDDHSLLSGRIAIVDFQPWVDQESREARLKIAKELVEASHDTGFVYIRNHGISEALLEEAFSWNKKFFALDDSKKAQAAHPPGSDAFRGYSKVGHETVPPHEEDKLEGVLDYNVSLLAYYRMT
jgi:isopenicillin N synthase-like dioxygenase